MESHNINPLSFLLLFMTLAIVPCIRPTHVQAYNPTADDFISSMCSKTPDQNLCETAIRSDPRSSQATDPTSLSLLIIDIVKSRFSDAVKFDQDLSQKTQDPDVVQGLKKCISLYEDVVINSQVKSAIYAVKAGNPKFGEEAMTDAGNTADFCQSEFPTGKIPPELPGQTQSLHGISNVAAAIIKTLE